MQRPDEMSPGRRSHEALTKNRGATDDTEFERLAALGFLGSLAS